MYACSVSFGVNVQSSRISLPSTFWSILPNTYWLPYVDVISGSPTRVTHWSSFFSIVSVGPTLKLTFVPGFHRAESSPCHSSDARARWYVVPWNSNTTGLRLSVESMKFTCQPDGMSASGPPRVNAVSYTHLTLPTN